jgi:hypothetical protein
VTKSMRPIEDADKDHPARAEHPSKLIQGDDEDYVDYLTRQGDAWSNNPPPPPPGFDLIPCEATPRHWPHYVPVDHDFYPSDCPDCQYASLADAHGGCAHSQHRAWRRWKITGKVSSWLYTSGLTPAGGSWQMGNGCHGCQTLPKWNRNQRVYILFVSRETWHCLLKRHHRPTVDRSFGLCTKCYPCADCGSTETGHYPGECGA